MTKPVRNQPGQPGQARVAAVPGAGRAADIMDLVMSDHRRIRRLCEALSDAARSADGPGPHWAPGQLWQRLADLLVAHFRAEEEICYLPMFGAGPAAAGQRREAIADHDDIREAIDEASLQRPGSPPWWRAVRAALTATVEHVDREESGVMTACLPRLTLSQRLALGRQWSEFSAAWAREGQPRASGPAVRRVSRRRFLA